jgi:hypothetical protein
MDRRPPGERAADPVCPATAPGGGASAFARGGSFEVDAAEQAAADTTRLRPVEVVEEVRN